MYLIGIFYPSYAAKQSSTSSPFTKLPLDFSFLMGLHLINSTQFKRPSMEKAPAESGRVPMGTTRTYEWLK